MYCYNLRMSRLARYLPSVALFLAGLGVQVSGFENVWVALSLWALAALLAIVVSWNWLKRLRFSVEVLPQSEVRRTSPKPQAASVVAMSSAKEELRVLFRSVGDPALNAAHELLGGICRKLSDRGDARRGMSLLINQYVMEGDRAARTALGSALEPEMPRGIHDVERLQELFGDYYEKYQFVVTWIGVAGILVDFPFESDTQYRQWRELDKEFLGRLRDLIARTGFEVLDTRVRAVGWGERYRSR